MFGYYTFNFRDDLANHTLCIFKSDSHFVSNELIDLLDRSFKKHIGLNNIVLIISDFKYLEITDFIESNQDLKNAFTRDRKINNIALIGFNEYGEFNNHTNIKGTNNLQFWTDIRKQIIYEGILGTCKNNQVINIAPPRTQFKKMSEKLDIEFIRASNMQASDAETSFLAFSLLQYWADLPIDYIYVDTMSIVPMLYKLINVKKDLNANIRTPQIITYSSYTGIENIHFVNKDRSLIIVSASSSGTMATKLLELHTLRCENVITLLSYVDAPQNTKLLCNIKDIRPEQKKKTPGLSTIQIVGEYFSTQIKEPREVLLGSKHAPKNLQKDMHVLMKDNLFNIKKNTKEIYVDGSILINLQSFKDWFMETLTYTAPVDISYIIHTNDEASKKMAENVLIYYSKYLFKKKLPTVLSAEELAGKNSDVTSRGVLVVSAIVSQGSELLSISRDLRDFSKNTSKTFILGLVLPKSLEVFNIFKWSLIYSPNRENHNFYTFMNLPIGERGDIESTINSWNLEFNLLKKDTFEEIEFAQERLRLLLNDTAGLSNKCFYKNIQNNTLKLRDDFVFWKPEYDTGLNNSASVYLTIAIVLQKGRENKTLAPYDRLYSDDYQRAVLSPDCFSRFNDGIIQASLLRAATPRELNYTVSKKISKNMTDILLRIILHCDTEKGEAVFEFLIALATKRMQLIELDIDHLIEKLESSPMDTSQKEFSKLLLIKAKE